ncbi:MAG: methionine gamma-lyase family protein [Clostridia bacterium]|nr:methionine gamma-lyase family protein [Clostridia bacterium]
MPVFPEKLLSLASAAEKDLAGRFGELERTAFLCQCRVQDAFSSERVSAQCLDSTTGYGYNDLGRETLDRVFARVFETEAAFARHSLVSGTHALTVALFGLLRPGDELLCATGWAYDTLDRVIGISGGYGEGSLADFGVKYVGVDLTPDGEPDEKAILSAITPATKVVYFQKSRGYSERKTVPNELIGKLCRAAKEKKNDVFTVVDNCYGEFCEEHEPTYYGADLCVGSLIKNPGGGVAKSGGYLAGTSKAIELCSYRLTCPGTGLECGATLSQNADLFRGLYLAPHVVCQALRSALFASELFTLLGFEPLPKPDEKRFDIIQAIRLGSKERLEAFCRGIQAGSPVDSHVRPEFWEMPGYEDQVIMAAGTFVQGASIELSADAPLREPFTVFMQGGVTYESAKLGILSAARELTAL